MKRTNFLVLTSIVCILSSCGNVAKKAPDYDNQDVQNTNYPQPSVINPAPQPSNDDWTPTISEQTTNSTNYESMSEDKQKEIDLINARARAYHSGVNAGVVAGKNDALQGNPMNTSFIQKYGSDEDGLTTKWNEGFVDGYTYAYDGFKNNPNFILFTYDGDYVIH